MTSYTLLIRADASAAIGTGHVMRCIALAQAWQDAGGRTTFAIADRTDAVGTRLAAEHCDVFPLSALVGTRGDVQQTIAIAQERGCEWVVVDGYRFNAEYQRALKAANIKVLLVDDYGHSDHHAADLVLNQNACATPKLYSSREPYTELLLGTRYAMLRREFDAWREWQRTIQPVCNRVLVMMGGSDEGNITATVVDALQLLAMHELEATVVVGGSNPHFDRLRDQIAKSALNIHLMKDVSNIGELMAKADLAVSAAGSACWELCLSGLPTLLVDVADNQTAVAKDLDKRECAVHVGNRNITPEIVAERMQVLIDAPELRQSLSCRSRELVDGKGAARVASILRGQEALRLRPAQLEDRRLLWEWANDPDVRASSFSPDPISWETHVVWFNEKFNSSHRTGSKSLIFIAEDEKKNATGQIRFDSQTDGDWEVAISVNKHLRGRGLGTELVAAGVRELLKQSRTPRIHAHVKPVNLASVKSFERAAFCRVGIEQVRGNPAIHLIYQ